ncbi:MAG: outer membrane lipoprotein [Burkholderiales bacterium]|nr:glycine zipper 2TM domain-containing protein [Ferrovum sp.]
MTDPTRKTSPFVIAASIAVMLFSLVGIAALTGLLPKHGTEASQPAESSRPPEQQPQALLGSLPQPGSQIPPGLIQPSVCADCGVITAIRLVEKQGEGSALGVVAGGLMGGILGHQLGGGAGKDVATIAGAVGGGYAGNEIEKRANSTQIHEITVRMDDGRSHTLAQQANPAFRVGDRVRVINGALRPY